MSKVWSVIPALALALGALPAAAQSRPATANSNAVITEPAPVVPPTAAPRQEQAPHTLFSIGGLGVQIATPVVSPYNAAGTYGTFGGQPMDGRDAFLAAAIPHPPNG